MVHPTAPTATSKFKPYSYEMDSGISDYKLIKAWVESGDCVAHTYSSLREDARILAINRNKMLEAATNAFLCGKKDIARNLSRQGQLLNIQMKQLHVEAAKTIFSKRNPESLIRRGQVRTHSLLTHLLPHYLLLSLSLYYRLIYMDCIFKKLLHA